MTPSEVLRGVADAIDRDDIDLRMTHPVTADEPFRFLGEGTSYLGLGPGPHGEKDGSRYYHVHAERILKELAKWVHKIRVESENEAAASKPRIIAPTGKIALS